jgi:hypothetical protein
MLFSAVESDHIFGTIFDGGALVGQGSGGDEKDFQIWRSDIEE